MNIYLIGNDRTIDAVLDSSDYVAGRDVIICFNYLVLLRMQKEGSVHRAVFLEELLSDESYRQLHAATDVFAMEWYKVDGRDITEFEGTSFGLLVENMFPRKYMVNLLVKIGEVMRRAIERWSDASAFYCDFTDQGNAQRYEEGWNEQFFQKVRTAALVADQLGRPFHRMKAPAIVPPMYSRKAASTKSRLKGFLKKLFILGLNTIGAPARILSKPSVFVFGYHNLQSIEPGEGKRLITNNYKFFQGSPRHLLSGGRVLDLEGRHISLDETAVRFLRGLQEQIIAKNSYKRSDMFTLNGISYYELYQPVLRDLVENVIPDLLRTIRYMRRSIRRYTIEQVMFIDTIDTISRAHLLACQQEGCKTLVVYHGLFDNVSEQEVVKRRIAPDVLVTPGDPAYSPQYLDNFLTPPRQVLANFGTPIIDPYVPEKRKRVTSIKKVLFLTMNDGFYCNMSRFPYQEKYLAEIMSIFGTLTTMGIEVHYRAHPGENMAYNRYVLDFLGVDVSSVHFSNGVSFHDLIYDMDLMVTNISTAFFESQAAGIPTVFFDPYYRHEAVQPPLNGVNGEEVIRMSTGSELLELIQRNQHDPRELNTFLDRFLNMYISRYVGPMNSHVGKRVGEYLSGAMQED